MGQMVFPGNPTSPPQVHLSPNVTESSFPLQVNGAPVAPAINGNGHSRYPETPLSANVPVFEPVNGVSDPLKDETTFSDDQVAELTLVYQSPKGNDNSSSSSPFHNASSRTFSNGSIDGKSIVEELYDSYRQGRTLTNGSRTSEA
jgi:la-related protein 1